jgi:hypothetical protein
MRFNNCPSSGTIEKEINKRLVPSMQKTVAYHILTCRKCSGFYQKKVLNRTHLKETSIKDYIESSVSPCTLAVIERHLKGCSVCMRVARKTLGKRDVQGFENKVQESNSWLDNLFI